MDASREIGRELAPNWITVFQALIHPYMKNHLIRNVARIVQFGPLSKRRPKGLLYIGLDAFDFQVLFPQIEDDKPLSRFVHLIL
jgi:hypothetical protein